MPRLNANPNAEANVAFDTVKPGTYRLRVESIEQFTAKSGNECWRVRLAYIDSVNKLDGMVAQHPGTILDASLVVSPADKQGKTRGFVESLGMQWADLDSEQLIGLECEAQVKVENDNNGNPRNVVGRYLAKK